MLQSLREWTERCHGVACQRRSRTPLHSVHIANKLCVFCAFKAQLDYDLMAKNLGFARSHGQPVYRRGNEYISPDVDRHNRESGREPPATPPTCATRQRATARSTKI